VAIFRKRSRRKIAGNIPIVTTTMPMTIASPAAPSTISSNRRLLVMMARRYGVTR
jgi:hypothetical protein